MRCPKCSETFSDDLNQCPSCGAFVALDHEQQQAVASKKVLAGVLGIVLGALGIHKFVLGYNTAGIIMLLVSVLSCGFLAGIMSIIGLIEGILYLTKTDADFYQIYILNRKEWF